MKLKVFTFRFSENADGFNDEPMQEFIADKEIIEFSEHFFVHEKTPYLTVLISYRDISKNERAKLNRKFDPRKELDSREKETYDVLRAWRAERAKKEGIPPYMIANNKQIGDMVKLRAKTRADLARIKGIGDAKTSQYGEDILKILAKHLLSDRASDEASDPAGGPDTDKESET